MNPDDFLTPEAIKDFVSLAKGMMVADFGSGSGEFSLMMARLVGDQGAVTAIDVRHEPLKALEEKAKSVDIKNINYVRANLEVAGSTKLADKSQDRVLLANVLFQSKVHGDIIREATRVLKNDGKLIIIDWKKGEGGFGPPNELRIDAKQIVEVAQSVGLKLDREFEAGRFHFGLSFNK